jgi:hypothetical protein
MTVTAPASPELADSPCTVGECLEPAGLMASATVQVDPKMRVPADFETITFGLPLCRNHAELLRLGCTLSRFNSGL